jgi:uncharacterized membrane protein YecN with MAPEG domain
MPLLGGSRPDPPPLETDDVRTVAVGASAWALALLVLVVLRVTDAARVETWWMVMCGYGLLLGVVGVRYCQHRRAAIERDKARGLTQRD